MPDRETLSPAGDDGMALTSCRSTAAILWRSLMVHIPGGNAETVLLQLTATRAFSALREATSPQISSCRQPRATG